MLRRNLFLCGACLAALSALGTAQSATSQMTGAQLVSDQEAGSVTGAQYCIKMKKLDGKHCAKCTTGFWYYTPDNNGTSQRRCFHVCISGGMQCDPDNPCDGCEVEIPCSQEFCDAPGACP
jgi:hypothetical protein